VPRIRIREKKKVGEYCYVDSKKALLALIAAGVVELHTWNACVDDVEHPDRIVLDIDPGPRVPWRAVVEAARDARRMLRDHDLQSWVKTTGAKGLHVVAPFERGQSWDEVFELSRAVASELCDTDPDKYTLAFAKSDRADRILIDYKRNYRTSIAAAAFSMRAKPQGTVSVPVSWQELGRLTSGSTWTVANIRDRLKRQRKDPWSA
jgi:bifunctional non-homologous end joining protein LigD